MTFIQVGQLKTVIQKRNKQSNTVTRIIVGKLGIAGLAM